MWRAIRDRTRPPRRGRTQTGPDDHREDPHAHGAGGALHVVPVDVDGAGGGDVRADHTDDEDHPQVVHPRFAGEGWALFPVL